MNLLIYLISFTDPYNIDADHELPRVFVEDASIVNEDVIMTVMLNDVSQSLYNNITQEFDFRNNNDFFHQ